MKEIIDIIFEKWWHMVGFIVFFNLMLHYLINGCLKFWSRFMRMMMVRKSGWPPEHLDADGDWPPHLKEKAESKKTWGIF